MLGNRNLKLIKIFKDNLKLARRGDNNARLIVRYSYKYGLGIKQNFKTSLSWFKKASKYGNVEATYEVGVSFFMALLAAEQTIKKLLNIICWLPIKAINPQCIALLKCIIQDLAFLITVLKRTDGIVNLAIIGCHHITPSTVIR